MKTLMTVTGIILLMCIMITGLYAPKGTAAPPEKSFFSEISVTEQSSTINENKYRLSVYEKKVAAFENGKDYPIYISDVYVSSLSETDRELLEKGIYASERKALNRLIEDYCR